MVHAVADLSGIIGAYGGSTSRFSRGPSGRGTLLPAGADLAVRSDAMADGVVYVIDDDLRVRRALCRLLDSVNLSAEAFPSAEAFLEHSLPDQPSCLVLDLHLGNGRSGLDFQAELGARQQTIPIIFITGVGSGPASVRA